MATSSELHQRAQVRESDARPEIRGQGWVLLDCFLLLLSCIVVYRHHIVLELDSPSKSFELKSQALQSEDDGSHDDVDEIGRPSSYVSIRFESYEVPSPEGREGYEDEDGPEGKEDVAGSTRASVGEVGEGMRQGCSKNEEEGGKKVDGDGRGGGRQGRQVDD